MNRELELWQFIARRLEKQQNVMLLVVAESSGSSPGRHGYKMAVAQDGDLMGSIGGGAMEVNLVNQSRQLLSEPPASAGGFPGTDDNPASFLKRQVHQKHSPNASGMICSGKQTVIFKLLAADDLTTVNTVIDSLKHHSQHTLNVSPVSFTVEPTPIADLEFTASAENDFDYKERLGPKNDLYIIGGGHCALALSELMSKMDFYIRLIDDRPELSTIVRNPFVNEKHIIERYELVDSMVASGNNAYIVVMTLGYGTDETVIKRLIDKDVRYIGVLGSKAKMAALFKNLKDEGFTDEKLQKLHTPIGLPINSRTPEEIAVSIAAEIIAIKNSE